MGKRREPGDATISGIDNALYVLYCLKDVQNLSARLLAQSTAAIDGIIAQSSGSLEQGGIPLFASEPEVGSTAQLLEILQDDGKSECQHFANFIAKELGARHLMPQTFPWQLAGALTVPNLRDRIHEIRRFHSRIRPTWTRNASGILDPKQKEIQPNGWTLVIPAPLRCYFGSMPARTEPCRARFVFCSEGRGAIDPARDNVWVIQSHDMADPFTIGLPSYRHSRARSGCKKLLLRLFQRHRSAAIRWAFSHRFSYSHIGFRWRRRPLS
jgi:hypothetical protein